MFFCVQLLFHFRIFCDIAINSSTFDLKHLNSFLTFTLVSELIEQSRIDRPFFSYTFNQAGTFSFYMSTDEAKTMTITVMDASTQCSETGELLHLNGIFRSAKRLCIFKNINLFIFFVFNN